MRATEFAELQAFELVAKHNNFSKAALELGMSRSAVTQTIQSLERRLGIRLLNRTTRNVSLTYPGQELLAQIEPALAALSNALTSTQKYRDVPSGIVRVAVPPLAAKMYIEPMLSSFREAYPDVTLDIRIGHTEYHDCVSEGLDAALGLEDQIHQDMIALKLGHKIHYNLVASPSYLAHYGDLELPQDLHKHKCIAVRVSGNANFQVWPFRRDNKNLFVTIERPMILNNEVFALDAAINGAGILFCARELSADMVRQGRLISLLDDWCIDGSRYVLYYPTRLHQSAAFQVFKTHLRESVAALVAKQALLASSGEQ